MTASFVSGRNPSTQRIYIYRKHMLTQTWACVYILLMLITILCYGDTNPTKTGYELGWAGRISSSCSKCGIRRNYVCLFWLVFIIFVLKIIINHGLLFITGLCSWSVFSWKYQCTEEAANVVEDRGSRL